MYNKYNIDRGLVFSAAFFAVGVFLANFNMYLALAVLGAILLGALIIKRKRLVLYAGVFGAALVLIWWILLPVALLDKYQGEVSIYGHVTAESRSGYYTIVELDAINENVMPIKTKVAVSKAYTDEHDYQLGEMVCFRGEFYQPQERTNPGGFSSVSYWRTQGVFRMFDADEGGIILDDPALTRQIVGNLRIKIDDILQANLSADSYQLSQALLFGDKAALDDDFYALSQKMGIAHVFAVSGLHVGLVVSFVLGIFHIFKKDNSWVCFISLCIIVLFYCALSNFTVSANRAAIMALLAFLARKRLRFKDFYSIFAVAVLVTLAANPYALYAVGAQLSFGVTWSLVFFMPLFQRLLAPLKIKKVIDSLAVVFAAQIVSIPLCAWHFYNISLLSPIFNLLIVPIIGIIVPLILLSLMMAVILPFAAKIFFTLSTILLEGVEKFLTYFAAYFGTGHHYIGQPSMIILVLFVAVFVVWSYDILRKSKRWHNVLYCMAAVALLIIIILPPMSKDQITVLDVGQGSGAVVETADGKCVVFDCGRSKDTVASYLRYRGINHVEAIVLSHADTDHIGGLSNILRDFTVDKVIATDTAWQDEVLVAFEEDGVFSETEMVMAQNETLNFGALAVQLVPFADSQDLFALAKLNDVAVAFTGDMSKTEQMEIVLTNPQIDIWLVPHHGSKSNLLYGLYKRLDMDLAVISVGRYNHYGHPGWSVLNEITNSGIWYERTDKSGAIMLKPYAGEFTVEKFLP